MLALKNKSGKQIYVVLEMLETRSLESIVEVMNKFKNKEVNDAISKLVLSCECGEDLDVHKDFPFENKLCKCGKTLIEWKEYEPKKT